MEKYIKLTLFNLISILILITESFARRDATCFKNFGVFAEYCPTDEHTECGVTAFGAPMGCVKASECGAAVSKEHLECDASANKCCCKAQSAPCNTYQDEGFEKEQLCTTFPNATACLLDSSADEVESKCRRSDDSEEICEDNDNYLCGFDGDGRPRGCLEKNDCPGSDEIFYFDPKCNEEYSRCCCVPLVEAYCNDWTVSPELKAFMTEEVIPKLEKMRMKDSALKIRGSNLIIPLNMIALLILTANK